MLIYCPTSAVSLVNGMKFVIPLDSPLPLTFFFFEKEEKAFLLSRGLEEQEEENKE